MTLWILFAVMSLVALAFVVWPMYRQERRLTGTLAVVVVAVVALSSGLYYYQGQPNLPSGEGALPEMDAVIESLAKRLESNPDDINGWQMLGRSYMALGNYAGAIDALERAIDLESGQNAQTLVSLGEAKLASSQSEIEGDISALFESALAIDPNNPQALFYGGIGAFNRNDQALAASRWERLLGLNPPPEIEGILRQRIAEWRGEPMPAPAAPPQAASQPIPETSAPAERPDVIVSARVTLSDAAMASLQQDAMVFIMARDPAQPSPPIAVTRAMLSQFPLQVEFTNGDSMMEGRQLAMFEEFELIARVAVSGQRTQQPGDWFGTLIVKPAENKSVQLSISEQVP
jgi:cytochrome c-type biogenesis protein CcmH